jgi:hypothetical protein
MLRDFPQLPEGPKTFADKWLSAEYLPGPKAATCLALSQRDGAGNRERAVSRAGRHQRKAQEPVVRIRGQGGKHSEHR